MRRKINGRSYDTDSARLMGSYSEEPVGSPKHIERAVYMATNTGLYFLYTKGGKESRYAEQVGEYKMQSQDITPLTEAQAMYVLDTWNDGRDVVL